VRLCTEEQDPGVTRRRRISLESANLIGSPQDDGKVKVKSEIRNKIKIKRSGEGAAIPNESIGSAPTRTRAIAKPCWENIGELIRWRGLGDLLWDWARAANPCLQAVHVEIDDGSGEEREHLAYD
jgi:hypothetical protein